MPKKSATPEIPNIEDIRALAGLFEKCKDLVFSIDTDYEKDERGIVSVHVGELGKLLLLSNGRNLTLSERENFSIYGYEASVTEGSVKYYCLLKEEGAQEVRDIIASFDGEQTIFSNGDVEYTGLPQAYQN